MDKKRVRAIAFYLPQFYPTPENDEWWEPGFTEWTNVAKAKPLFRGHYQPRIPRDLGFYDLRVPETREKQAQMAYEAGIEGFCYWHYWFGNGKRLLSDVFKEIVETGKPDFPFCLCWANHSWYAKTWNPDTPDKLLIEQTYPGVDDYTAHFYEMLPAFKDERYMKVGGKLIFGVFAPLSIPHWTEFTTTWNSLARENGIPEFYFFAFCQGEEKASKVQLACGQDVNIVFDNIYDAHISFYGTKAGNTLQNILKQYLKIIRPVSYCHYCNSSIKMAKRHPDFHPCICPDFDHTPRSAGAGTILHGSTPQKWHDLLKVIANITLGRPEEERLLFIKAWNEWGEGNYIEPDQKWGKAYLEETQKILALNHEN